MVNGACHTERSEGSGVVRIQVHLEERSPRFLVAEFILRMSEGFLGMTVLTEDTSKP